MRRIVLIVMSLALATPALAKEKVRTLAGSWPATGRAIQLELPPGSMTIEPARDGRLSATLDVLCNYRGRRCEERANELSLSARAADKRLELTVGDLPPNRGGGMEFRGRIQVPPGAALTIHLGVGELDVRGHEGSLDVDVGVGEVRILAPARALRFAEVNVGVGDAELAGAGGNAGTRGWIGRRIDWTGRGTSNLRISVGVGEAKVTLQ